MKINFRNIIKFFTEMESTTQRAVWIAFILFTIAGFVLTFGMSFVNFNEGAIAEFLRSLHGKWWAPFAVTLVFTVLAFLGAPQIVMIAATVAVFGTNEGTFLSWIATMISAYVGYFLGKKGGSEAVHKILGKSGAHILNFIGKNGFLTSVIVRQVPTGPFILVNLALGASGVTDSMFILGTGIGILPKILLVTFGAHGIGEMMKGKVLDAVLFFVGAAIVWALIVFVVRPLLVKSEKAQ